MPPSLKQRLVAGGSWVLAGKGLTALANLAVTAVAANLITKEEFGAYGMAVRLGVALALLSQLGLQWAVVRFVAQSMGVGEPGRARAAIGIAFRLTGIGVAVMVVLVLLGGGRWITRDLLGSEMLAAVVLVIAALAALRSFEFLISETFRGFQDLRFAVLFGGLISGSVLLVLIVSIAYASGGTTLRQVLLLTAAALAVSVAAGGILVRRRAARLPPPASLPSREVLSVSLPMWVNGLTGFALVQADVLIIGAFLSEIEAAEYFAAARLVELLSQPLILVNLVVPPFIAELYFRGEIQRLQRVLRASATLAGIPALVVLLGFLAFGGRLMEWIFTAELRGGAAILTVLALGKLVNVLTGSCGVTMTMTGHQTQLLRITVLSGLLTVVASLLAVRPFGAVGVAGTVATGIAAQNIAMWWSTHRHTGLWTHVGIPRMADVRSLLGRGSRS